MRDCMRVLALLCTVAVLLPGRIAVAQEKKEKQQPTVALVVDGRARATIVLPDKPGKPLVFAAKQLQQYVQKISGALLPIASEQDKVSGNRILLWPKGTPAEAGLAVPEDLGEEEYLISTTGSDLVIGGGSDLGTFFGVCGLLEDHLGVRWYVAGDPLGECVPKMKDIVLPRINDRQGPDFPMRWIGKTLQWAKMNRQNYPGGALDVGFKIKPGIFHTQDILLPTKTYFAEHPEYYALVDGKRGGAKHGWIHLCHSNKDVVRIVAQNMGKILDADPDVDLVTFAPTDWTQLCECEACKAMDDKGEVPKDQRMSRRMLIFHNRLAEALTKTHPNAKLLVGAYLNYTRPPNDKSIRALPALSVVICDIQYCMAHPVNDPNCPPNRVYDEIIKGWQALGCDIYFYEYYYKVNWMGLPWPITHKLAVDIPYFKSVGVKGVYTQFTTQNAWKLFPGYYVAAKLMWDVDADVDRILDEMCNRLFGKGGPAMREYYRVMEDSMANCGRHFPGRGTTFGQYVFTPAVMKTMGDSLATAHELAEDELVKKRLAKIDLSFEYTQRLMKYVRLRDRIGSKDNSPQEALAIAQQALDVLGKLVTEVRQDRAKWDGIVSTGPVSEKWYLGPELRRLRARVEQLQR